MKINQIRYVLATVEYRNFSHAAKKCGVSVPSLTKGIYQIESHFQGSLFQKIPGQRLAPTGLCLEILPSFQEIIKNIEKSNLVAKQRKGYNQLKIGISDATNYLSILENLEKFELAKGSKCEKTIIQDSCENILELLIRGDVEFFFINYKRKYCEKLISFQKIAEEDMVVLAPIDHPLAGLNKLSISDLDGNVFVYREGCNICKKLLNQGIFSGSFSAKRIDWIVAMVSNGLASAILPAGCAKTSSKTIVLPFKEDEMKCATYVGFLRGRKFTKTGNAFNQYLSRIAARNLDGHDFSSS